MLYFVEKSTAHHHVSCKLCRTASPLFFLDTEPCFESLQVRRTQDFPFLFGRYSSLRVCELARCPGKARDGLEDVQVPCMHACNSDSMQYTM